MKNSSKKQKTEGKKMHSMPAVLTTLHPDINASK